MASTKKIIVKGLDGSNQEVDIYAADSDKLGGQAPAYYAKQSDLNGKAPTSHASTATTYGVGSASNYGHVKVIDNLTQGSNLSGTALSAYQGKVLKDLIDGGFPSKPQLTALTADGVVVGQSGWTGTGKMILSGKTAPDYGNGLANHIRFCLKLQNEEEWQDWTPYYDYNGTAYEFFYSQTRKVYDGLIPNESLGSQQILDKIRWVYKRRPDIIIYGSLAAGFTVNTNAETPVYRVIQDEGVLRKLGAEAARGQADMDVIEQIVNETLDLTAMPMRFQAKFCLAADTNGDFYIDTFDMSQIVRVVNGGVLMTIDTIDNWEG